MDRRQLWTATAFLLAGGGVTVAGWEGIWIATGFWGVAGMILWLAWKDELWEWRQSVGRKPKWTLSSAESFVGMQDGRVTMGLCVHNPQRDGEFYGRVDATRGFWGGPRPPWFFRWRSRKKKDTIGFDDRELIDLFWFKGDNPKTIQILHADPDERPAKDDSSEATLTGTLFDVAFRVSIRRANRRAVLRRWVRVAVVEPDSFGFEILDEGEEPD